MPHPQIHKKRHSLLSSWGREAKLVEVDEASSWGLFGPQMRIFQFAKMDPDALDFIKVPLTEIVKNERNGWGGKGLEKQISQSLMNVPPRMTKMAAGRSTARDETLRVGLWVGGIREWRPKGSVCY
jgi:hypothetical protein